MSHSDHPKTPTDALVLAMEQAEEMEDVIVLYRLKADENDHRGVGWISSVSGIAGKLALIEEAKLGMFADVYGLNQEP